MLGKRNFSPALTALSTITLLTLIPDGAIQPAQAEGTSVVGIIGPSPQIPVLQSSHVDYKINLFREYFFFYRPENHTTSQTFGLMVYIPPEDVMTDLPPGWGDVLARHHMLCLIPQRAGNRVKDNRRLGLTILGTLAIMQKYKIDSNRVFVGGLSGGARTAGIAAFYQSDLFKGTLQNCGADFYRPVPHKLTTNWIDSEGHPYGVFDASEQEIAACKSGLRFALITGPNDYRRGNILDLYNGGYAPQGFKCKVFDVPGMGHDHCSADTLDKVLTYLEGR